MIDVERDTLITMAEVSAMLPGWPSLCAIWRWRTRGVRGRKLETAIIGGKPYTTRAAVARFARFEGRSDLLQPRTPAQRQRAAEKASKELKEAGW